MFPRPSLVLLLTALLVTRGAAAVEAQTWEPEDPPFVATPSAIVEQMLRLGEVEPGDVVYDLGSGDGRLVIAAAIAGAWAVGIEYDRSLVERSWRNAEAAGVLPRVRFEHRDIFQTDFPDADVVMLYLSPEFNLRLRPILLGQLAAGSRVVSHAFHMGEWEPDRSQTVGTGEQRASIFSWTVPADLDGFWLLEVDGLDPVSLEVVQRFQRFEGGTGSWTAGNPLVIRSGRIDGTEVRFELLDDNGLPGEPLRFLGRFDGEALTGIVGVPTALAPRSWSARRYSAPEHRAEGGADDR